MSIEISVLTPSLNYGRYLRDAIESVARQEGVAVEHVIQDGGSSDGTSEILRKSPSHVVWTSEPDGGQAEALNRALERARGEWIAWLNADEFYLPRALKALLDTARARHVDVLYGDTVFVDERGRLERLMAHHPFDPWYLRWYGCYFASCSTLFRRESLAKVRWDERFRLAMDWDLYLRLDADKNRFGYLRFPVGAFRLHPAQVIAREKAFGDEFKTLAARHGVRSSWERRLGQVPHDVHKLLRGAYPTQLRARRLKGHDVRWFVSDEGDETARRLLAESYRRS